MPKGKRLNENLKPASNYLITPPDILDNNLETFLIINATEEELSAFSKFLPWARNTYNFYLYNNNIQDSFWLEVAAKKAIKIIAARHITSSSLLEPILDYISKIVWFGEKQTFTSPTEFLAAYERNTSK